MQTLLLATTPRMQVMTQSRGGMLDASVETLDEKLEGKKLFFFIGHGDALLVGQQVLTLRIESGARLFAHLYEEDEVKWRLHRPDRPQWALFGDLGLNHQHRR